MNAWSTIHFTMLAAGLGLFLYGVSMLEESIKSLAGRTFKLFLQRQTGHPVKAILAGALTTAVMQSSSTVTLLVMSFTGSGIIPLQNGIGLILGANLGTTFTGWIVALLGFSTNPESLYLFLIAAGALGVIFLRPVSWAAASRLVFGFGLLFLGLFFMKESLADFATNTDVAFLVGKPLLIFTLFGFLLAAALRSSTAAMVIFLTSLSAGTISLEQAAYLAVGADLGTTMTGLLGTINGNATRKKTGWSQFYINVITAVATLALLHPLLFLIQAVGVTDPLVSLVSFHSLFNLLGIILILPFIRPFTRWIDTRKSSHSDSSTLFLGPGSIQDVVACIDALERETGVFIATAISVRQSLYAAPQDNTHSDAYYRLKEYENAIFNYALPVLQKSISQKEAQEVEQLFSTIRAATLAVKEIKDIRHNVSEFRQSSRDDVYQLEVQIGRQVFETTTQLSHLLINPSFTEGLTDSGIDIEQSYAHNKSSAFHAFREKQDFDIASLLNLIREVRDSNQLLVTAITTFHACVPETKGIVLHPSISSPEAT